MMLVSIEAPVEILLGSVTKPTASRVLTAQAASQRARRNRHGTTCCKGLHDSNRAFMCVCVRASGPIELENYTLGIEVHVSIMLLFVLGKQTAPSWMPPASGV